MTATNRVGSLTFQIGVGDIDAGVAFYTRFLGRAPDFEPHANFAEWEVVTNAWLQINSERDVGSGVGPLRIEVDDIERALDQAVPTLAIDRPAVQHRDGVPVRWCTFSDPWGNRLGYFETIEAS